MHAHFAVTFDNMSARRPIINECQRNRTPSSLSKELNLMSSIPASHQNFLSKTEHVVTSETTELSVRGLKGAFDFLMAIMKGLI
jgi:hypothetical protein